MLEVPKCALFDRLSQQMLVPQQQNLHGPPMILMATKCYWLHAQVLSWMPGLQLPVPVWNACMCTILPLLVFH